MPKTLQNTQQLRFMVFHAMHSNQVVYIKFAAVSCSFGVPLQNTEGCLAGTLEHFQILTPSCPKRSKTYTNWDLWYFMQYIQIKYIKFAAVSCSLGVPLQNIGGCPTGTLEHFQILTPSCPKRPNTHNNWDLWYFIQYIPIKYIKFAALSCSLGVPLQNAGGCPAGILEHFQVLTP